MGGYNDRYEQLKIDRAKEREQAIKAGQMADPNQPTSLNKAITPVGTCTSMCPDFERVERIVQKMVDKSEKVCSLTLPMVHKHLPSIVSTSCDQYATKHGGENAQAI
jgi:hypothetical protein